jgi:hypothetical protein
MVILAMIGAKCIAAGAAAAALCAEQGFEEIAVIGIARVRSAELEAGIPVGRGPEILAGAMLPEMIVGGSLLGILQHFIGFPDFLEAGFRVLFLADIRVVFARQLAVGLLDLRLGCITRDAHDLVIILELHRSPCSS